MLLLGVVQAQAFETAAAGSYDLLATEILTTTTASVTFSSLGDYAADYEHLQIRYVGRNANSTNLNTRMRLNGDTGSNYSIHSLIGNGSSVSSQGFGSQTNWLLMGDNGTANISGFGVIDILDAFSTTKNKTGRILVGHAGDGYNRIGLNSGGYYSLSATSSATLLVDGGSWASGSRFSLYGIRG
jgi:hypothetical protein